MSYEFSDHHGDEDGQSTYVYEDHEIDKGFRARLWIASLLAAAALCVFVADRFITLVKPNLDRLETSRDMKSVKHLEDDVLKVLEGYGIDEKWINKKKVALPEHEHVRDEWQVAVPRDVPIASVNHDLNQSARTYNGKSFAVENAKTSQVCVHIKFRDLIRYSLVFTPSTVHKRMSGSISILVDGVENAPKSEVQSLLITREPIGCIIVPDREIRELHDMLKSAGKYQVLHLHIFPSNPDQSRYSLSEDLSEHEIQKRIRFIVKNFPGAAFYYLTSERAIGSIERATDEEMLKLGVKKLETSNFSYIDRTSSTLNMTARMNDIAAIAARDGIGIGVVELKEGIVEFLMQEMNRLRKKGYDFFEIIGISRLENPKE